MIASAKSTRPVFLFSLLLCLVLSAGAAFGEDWGYDLGGELMSPFCPGRTLSSCPSPQAAELVQWIVTQEAAGATKEEVLEILIEKWGEEILGAPLAKGVGLWAYIVPVAGFVFLGGVAFVVLRNVSGGGPGDPGATGSGSVASNSGGGHAGSGISGESGSPDQEGPVKTDAELAAIVDAEIARRA